MMHGTINIKYVLHSQALGTRKYILTEIKAMFLAFLNITFKRHKIHETLKTWARILLCERRDKIPNKKTSNVHMRSRIIFIEL